MANKNAAHCLTAKQDDGEDNVGRRANPWLVQGRSGRDQAARVRSMLGIYPGCGLRAQRASSAVDRARRRRPISPCHPSHKSRRFHRQRDRWTARSHYCDQQLLRAGGAATIEDDSKVPRSLGRTMSKSMLKALKQEKQQQDSKPLWYARGKCYDRRQVSDKQELAKAVSAIPKPEWSYFDLRLWADATSDDREQQVLVSGSRPVLVVHLEDTLVSSLILEDGSMLVSKRPGADSFLCSVAEEYELVLLSSSRPAAARAVMKQLLDPQLFSGQLHANDVDAHDLNRLSSRQLVVTSRPEMSASNSDPDSVIVVPRYLADGRHEAEGQFMLLTKVLLHLATVPADVWRLALKRVREQGVLRSIQSGRQDLGRVLGGSKNCIKVQVQRNAAAMTVVNGADPYLPPAPEDGRPTLVLDLDETLVSSSRISTTDDPTVHLVTKRPGVEQFLAMVAGKFELVLWTASWQAYADAMVDKVLDPSGAGLFSHRLYAQHLVSDKKDLSKLGRRLDRVLVVDDSDWRYPQHLKDNLMLVSKYFGEEQDSELERVGKLLERLLASGVEDLRRGLVTASVNHA